MGLFDSHLKKSNKAKNNQCSDHVDNMLDDFFGSNDDFICGTPSVYMLENAVVAYKNGEPVCDDVDVREVEIEFSPDWERNGHMYAPDGDDYDVYTPLGLVDGNQVHFGLGEIFYYNPIEGHRTIVRAKKFICRGYRRYVVDEVLSDCYVREPVIPDKLKGFASCLGEN